MALPSWDGHQGESERACERPQLVTDMIRKGKAERDPPWRRLMITPASRACSADVLVNEGFHRVFANPPQVTLRRLDTLLDEAARRKLSLRETLALFRAGYSILFVPATSLLTILARAHAEGHLEDNSTASPSC